ncbi:MAG: hypothetical protein RLZZ156_2737 [Deinococcota bacterium]|jgi:hypothetical protein
MQTRDESSYVLRLWSDGGVYRLQLENLRTSDKQLFKDVREFEVFIKERVGWKEVKGEPV